MNRVVVLVIVLVALTGLIVWLASGSGHGFGTDSSSASFFYNVTLLVLVTSSLVLGWRGSVSEAARYAIIWIAIGFALVVGYAYRAELAPFWTRIGGEMNPSMPIERSGGEITLRASGDGHFYADAGINGITLRMLVDTGASLVVLSESDARRAGIDTSSLSYMLPVSTANGQALAAQVTLDEVRVGSIVRRNVRAAVQREMSGSLLGMSFFGSLKQVAFDANELVLKD